MAEIEKQNPENEKAKAATETVKKEEIKIEDTKPTNTTSGKQSAGPNNILTSIAFAWPQEACRPQHAYVNLL